ncbi:hypothetical protein HpBT0391_14430 [Helicobacter pylori]
MPNTTAEKDYTKYSQRQLFSFLNSIKTRQKRALEKLKEIQAQKQRIKKALLYIGGLSWRLKGGEWFQSTSYILKKIK